MGALATLKYHLSVYVFRYIATCVTGELWLQSCPPWRLICAEDLVRWGVWLGRHICAVIPQVPLGGLAVSRNLTLAKGEREREREGKRERERD